MGFDMAVFTHTLCIFDYIHPQLPSVFLKNEYVDLLLSHLSVFIYVFTMLGITLRAPCVLGKAPSTVIFK